MRVIFVLADKNYGLKQELNHNTISTQMCKILVFN